MMKHAAGVSANHYCVVEQFKFYGNIKKAFSRTVTSFKTQIFVCEVTLHPSAPTTVQSLE